MPKYLLPGLTARDYTLAAVLFMAEFSRNAFFLTFLPLYSLESPGLTVATAGIAASAHFLSENLLKIYAGWHLDRYGINVLRAGLALSLISLAVAGTFPQPVSVILASAVMGLGLSPMWASIITEVAPVNKKDRPLRVSLIFAAWLTGAGTGLAGINFFISRGFGLAFAVIMLSLLAAFTASFICPRLPRSQGEGRSPESLWTALSRLARGKTLIRYLLPGMFLQTLSASLLLPVLPVFAIKQLGLSHDRYGLLLLAGGSVTVIALFPIGRLVTRLRPGIVLSGAFFIASAGLSALSLMGNRHNAVLWVLVLGLSYAAILPTWNTLMARAVPPDTQATSWGVFSTVEGLGISLGPALGGMLAGRYSSASVLLAAAGILMAMALFYVVFKVESFAEHFG